MPDSGTRRLAATFVGAAAIVPFFGTVTSTALPALLVLPNQRSNARYARNSAGSWSASP
jgi:hypothetical protein